MFFEFFFPNPLFLVVLLTFLQCSWKTIFYMLQIINRCDEKINVCRKRSQKVRNLQENYENKILQKYRVYSLSDLPRSLTFFAKFNIYVFIFIFIYRLKNKSVSIASNINLMQKLP